jgi:hypothetical protein
VNLTLPPESKLENLAPLGVREIISPPLLGLTIKNIVSGFCPVGKFVSPVLILGDNEAVKLIVVLLLLVSRLTIGRRPAVACNALFADTLLSFQRATPSPLFASVSPAVSVNSVFESAASSQSTHPPSVLGSNPDID